MCANEESGKFPQGWMRRRRIQEGSPRRKARSILTTAPPGLADHVVVSRIYFLPPSRLETSGSQRQVCHTEGLMRQPAGSPPRSFWFARARRGPENLQWSLAPGNAAAEVWGPPFGHHCSTVSGDREPLVGRDSSTSSTAICT